MKKNVGKLLVLLIALVLTAVCFTSCSVGHIHHYVDGVCECGEKDPAYIPPHVHHHESEQTKAPSCTEKGVMTFTCECGDSYTEELEMLPHDYVDGFCSVCGQKDPETPEEIVLTATKNQAYRGETVMLSAIVDGKVSNDAVLTITQGSDIASILGNMLTVSDSANAGDVIKVQASLGGTLSSEVEITVVLSQEEINASRYFLTLSSDRITVDKYAASAALISVVVRNYNFQTVDIPLSYTVIDGDASILELENRGNTCALTAKGHGKVTVQVAIPNTDVTANVEVDVIVPPTSISIPEVFEQRRSIVYKFSMRDSLPFAIGIHGDKVAQSYELSFAHESGVTGDSVAVYDYETGEITFKMLGKVTVAVQSVSGSRLETKTSYTFDINNGYNVYSFAEAVVIGSEGNKYNGEEINFVILEKPVDPEGNYEYGYSLVPPVALLADAEQTVNAILKGVRVPEVVNRFTGEIITNRLTNARIQFVNKSAWINGNNHSIDASQIRVFTKSEFTAWQAGVSNGSEYMGDISSLFSIETWDRNGAEGSVLQGSTYFVKLYNFEVKGNAPINHNPGTGEGGLGFGKSGGGAYLGIGIGSYDYNTHYYIDANNITVSGCEIGMRTIGVVGNGTISNLYAYDCYSTGIMCKSSIMILNNIKFGPCGACGIELSPEESHEAGIADNEIQKVTITGTINTLGNMNNGQTTYFQNYDLGGATVPMIIEGNLQNYPDIWVSHLRNSNGQFVFVSLIFNDTNTFATNESIVEYPAYQAGGIIDIMQLPQDGSVDTTHQFITMDVYAPVTGLGNVKVGVAMFYNMHYQGE